jgi:hypothetical protein
VFISLVGLIGASCSRAVSQTSTGSIVSAHGGSRPEGDLSSTTVPAVTSVPSTSTTTTTPSPPPVPTAAGWTITSGTPAQPAVATTVMDIDAGQPGTPTVSCMRIDPALVRLRLISGTQEPDTSQPTSGAVPLVDRASLLAAFNSGFKLSQSRGGWFSDGRMAVPLRAGAASLVLRGDGEADVGVWGRDDTMGPSIVAVRQNLELLVDGGSPTPFVTTPAYELVWGKTLHHQIAVWRSGIGITKDRLLVYCAGQALTVPQLATGLLAAGAERAMELDINTQFVDAYLYRPSPTAPVGTKLVASMRYGPEHYLTPQARDFVEVLAR